MVTASHNPKEDNGYKVIKIFFETITRSHSLNFLILLQVYGKNGSQIISPVDKGIQEKILLNLEPLETSWDIDFVYKSDLLTNPLPEILEAYIKVIDDTLLTDHKAINSKTNLKFIYSAMHGVGYNYILEAFGVANLQLIPVVEQKDPDPDFPTVK